MYINDVIRQARSLYPSEYSSAEIYTWCDEVSSMLVTEDRLSYREIILPVMNDKTVLLPENVNIENIERVTANGREIPKTDLRGYDRRRIRADTEAKSVSVVYLAPYEPIRRAVYIGSVETDTERGTLVTGINEFIPGDILRVYDGSTELACVNLMSVTAGNDDLSKSILTVDGDISSLPETADNIKIIRHITEKTACDAPYDSMYIDYVLAMINRYQRDISAENRHMQAFNTKLYAYKKWLINRMPQDDGKFKNWWYD